MKLGVSCMSVVVRQRVNVVYCSQLTCSFCLVQVHQFEFRPKCIYIAVIIRKMLEAMLNTDAVDDKVNC